MLRLNDDLTDLFSELCDTLGRRAIHDEYLATPEPGVTRQYKVNRALEDVVMMPLITFLDCYECNGTMNLSTLSTFSSVPMRLVDASALAALCRQAAAVVARTFASLSTRAVEDRYFIFPARPDFARQEFGTAAFTKVTQNGSRHVEFSALMDVMEESEGPLSALELHDLKAKIKEDRAATRRRRRGASNTSSRSSARCCTTPLPVPPTTFGSWSG